MKDMTDEEGWALIRSFRRDIFAAFAMAAMLSKDNSSQHTNLERDAVQVADDLLKELDKK